MRQNKKNRSKRNTGLCSALFGLAPPKHFVLFQKNTAFGTKGKKVYGIL